MGNFLAGHVRLIREDKSNRPEICVDQHEIWPAKINHEYDQQT